MAWRSYVDPSTNEVWWTDDAGNFTQTPPTSSRGGAVSDEDIVTWANNLGRPDLVGWAREFVRKHGRLPNSLAEIAGASGSGKSYNQMASELAAAGYPGPWDEASVRAAYDRTVKGGTGGGQDYMGGTYGLDAAARAEKMAYEIRILEELQKPGLDLERRKQLINEYQMLSSITGYVTPGLWQMMQSGFGINTAGGGTGSTSLSNDAALDWIAEKRPDVAAYYQKNGWDVSTPEKRRAAVQNWISQGDPQWAGKTAQEVASALGYTAPAGATGGSTEGGTTNVAVTDYFQPMVDFYNDYVKRTGRQPTDQEKAGRLAQIAGITPQQAAQVYARLRQYQQYTGQANPTAAEFNQWIGQIAPQKTLERDKFEAGNQLGWANLFASKSGPRDYWVSNLMRANMPESVQWGNMQDLLAKTPSFGAVRPSDNSWEMAFAKWLQDQKGQTGSSTESGGVAGVAVPMGAGSTVASASKTPPATPPTPPTDTGAPPPSGGVQPTPDPIMGPGGRYDSPVQTPPPSSDWRGTFQQPNQLSRRRWSQMSPSLQQMQLGQWSAYGQDPQDAFDLMKRSWQGGTANTQTRWR